VLLLLLPEHVECDSWVAHNLLGFFLLLSGIAFFLGL
jgi:triphosphoribosyl-dephospho-CoA synthetase